VGGISDPFASARLVEVGDGGDSPTIDLSPLQLGPDLQQPAGSDGRDSRDSTRSRTAWTAAELLATDFPQPRWAVPGVICEGCTLLAGPPKVGKSWLTLGLGLAVASGGKALGAIDVTPGPVLYLALEDTPRRLQARLKRMLAGQPAPTTMTLATSCPPLRDGGAKHIAAWLDRNPDARLVVIDVFTRMRGPTPPGFTTYQADYAAVAEIKAIADAYQVAIVLVVHVRKAQGEDFLEDISGTNGFAGAADAIAVLRRHRGKADGALQITGRDVDEATYALRFGADLGTWQLLDGPADEYLLSETRAAILAAVRKMPGAGPRQIAVLTGLGHDLVRQTVRRMAEAGQVDTDGQGHYLPLSPPSQPSLLSPLSQLSQPSGGESDAAR
jgi:hypothetical protein